jgi:hypothetical protein
LKVSRKLRDRRTEPRPLTLVIFGVVAYLSAYWLACVPFDYPATRQYVERNDPLGGQFISGLMILFFTGWVYASLARVRFRIGFWDCGERAMFASVFGVGITVIGLGLVATLEVHDAWMLGSMLFGSLVFMLLAFVFSPVTYLGAMVGYGVIEGFGRLLVQR